MKWVGHTSILHVLLIAFHGFGALSRTSTFCLAFLDIKFPMEIIRQRNLRKFAILGAERIGAVRILIH